MLIYGCENWILTEKILELLEACFGELEKKAPSLSSTPAGYCSGDGVCKVQIAVGIGMLAGMLVCSNVATPKGYVARTILIPRVKSL